MSDEEKNGEITDCEKFICKDPKLNENFLARCKAGREWILDNVSSEKSVIPYEMIQRFDSPDILPEKGSFLSSSFLL